MSKLTKQQRKVLQDALDAATFENSSFDEIGPDVPIRTNEIKARTRLYRETWIIARIQAVLDGREREWSGFQ